MESYNKIVKTNKNASFRMKVPHIDLKVIQTNRTHTNKGKHFYTEKRKKNKPKNKLYLTTLYTQEKHT